ncbi:hypothetical protein V6K52_00300 [Knoellia sp. S7-12]|uniref:hypothetical protein n=1 Tax=Knoellia sp. S7-12 TaxID=3126698 RepID=UPI003367127A
MSTEPVFSGLAGRAKQEGTPSSVDLYWLPLGSGEGGRCVRSSGRTYEALTALRHDRAPMDLYHSALIVHLDGVAFTIEMTPVWAVTTVDRGVVGEGAVGLPFLGRARLFRYEVRCWEGGTIPDLAAAVDSPRRVSHDEQLARRVVDLVPSFPCATWGRDEQGAGEMWNSNSLTSWLLARSGHDTGAPVTRPPSGGRAPGWAAGLVVATRQGRLAPDHPQNARNPEP